MVLDAGAEDKRLMVVEGEFAGPLRAMTREGNTLSVLIRQAWDGVKLATLTKNSPLKATDTHNSIIGHITKTEVVRLLSGTLTTASPIASCGYSCASARPSPSAATGIPTTQPCWSSGSKTPWSGVRAGTPPGRLGPQYP
jgi:hypothetical protein